MSDYLETMGDDPAGWWDHDKPTQPAGIICQLPPPVVGSYELRGVGFYLTVKPCWFHRLMVRWILGWKWRDA